MSVWRKCLLSGQLSNFGPSLCRSLYLSLSLFLSLSLSFLNVVCSMCRPVTHRSPTLALAPFIRAEEDRWMRGLRTLSAGHFGVKTDGPRPCTANRNATWDSIWGIQNLQSTSAFETISWKKRTERRNYKDAGIFVRWNCFVTVKIYVMKISRQVGMDRLRERAMFFKCLLELLYFTYSHVIFNFSKEQQKLFICDMKL